MAKRCKILVHFVSGDDTEFFGGLHADEKLLRIYPAGENITVHIPLVSILWYTTEG